MMITVVVKHPGEKPKLIEIDNGLDAMQALVGGLIQYVYFDDIGLGIDMVCNEEGKLIGLDYNFIWNKDIVVGTVFFCAADNEGNSISITKEQIRYLTEIFETVIE